MTALAYAKINLTIDVLGKRADGYHDISSVMQTISLCDKLSFNITDRHDEKNEIIIESNDKTLPTDKTNLCFAACDMFFRQFGIYGKNVYIKLEKNIPVAAGLGGGSSDCAQTLRVLNTMLGVNASGEKLKKIAEKLGADVPFFIDGGRMKAEGIGDILTPVTNEKTEFVLLVKPADGKMLSKNVYKDFDLLFKEDHLLFPKPTTEAFLAAKGRKKYGYISNMLTPVTQKKQPSIALLKEKLISLGAAAAEMTGSGPTVFALFEHEDTADRALQKLRDHEAVDFCGLYKTVNNMLK